MALSWLVRSRESETKDNGTHWEISPNPTPMDTFYSILFYHRFSTDLRVIFLQQQLTGSTFELSI